MTRVAFTPNLRRHLDCPDVEVQAGTVREALERVFADNPKLESYIVDEQGGSGSTSRSSWPGRR